MVDATLVILRDLQVKQPYTSAIGIINFCMNRTLSHVALVDPACPRIFFFLSFFMEALTTSSEALWASAGISVTEIYEGDVFIDKPTRGGLLYVPIPR